MKFTIQRLPFVNYLSDVQRAISSKTTLEILKGIKLTLSVDALVLTGSNSDISIKSIISIGNDQAALEVDTLGSIVLPANFFINIVKKLPGETLTIQVNDRHQAIITSGSSEFVVNGMDAEDYPHLPEVEATEQLLIPSNVLKQMINQTASAVSTQEMRPTLTGVHFVLKRGELLAVATDSHRLSQRKINLPHADTTARFDVIVPGKALNELSKMLDNTSEDVVVQLTESQILFTLSKCEFYSRLLEGNYPDTERLIPTQQETKLQINALELVRAIDRASLLSHQGHNNVVRLSMNTTANRAILFSNSPEVGNVEEEIKFETLTGKDLEISFNPDYMRAALRAFSNEVIELNFTQALRPFTLEPIDEEELIQLITPVRTAN